MDFGLGDGSSFVLPSASDGNLYVRELSRVLRPGGIYCERCLCRPERPLWVSQLFDDLLSGRLQDLDVFRLELAMALQGDSKDGVSLQHVWRVWRERVPDPEPLGRRWGWAQQALRNFDALRHEDGRYSYPSQAEIEARAAPFFDVLSREPSDGERSKFIRFVMRARAAPASSARG
jgi:hypothetical protein